MDVGLEGLQLCFIFKGTGDSCDGWLQVGLNLNSQYLRSSSIQKERHHHTMTKTVSTPPVRMEGVTSLIMSSWRKWTCMSAAAGRTRRFVSFKCILYVQAATNMTISISDSLNVKCEAW